MRTIKAAIVAATIALGTVGLATPAHAVVIEYDAHVDIRLHDGHTDQLIDCLIFAEAEAKAGRHPLIDPCLTIAQAVGEDVMLEGDGVDITVPDGQKARESVHSFNNATVEIRGGDATAVAACVNYLQGTASRAQTSECSNSAFADGGNVNLHDVDITVIQT